MTLANLAAAMVTGHALVIGVAEAEARGDAEASARVVHAATVTPVAIASVAAVAATVAARSPRLVCEGTGYCRANGGGARDRRR